LSEKKYKLFTEYKDKLEAAEASLRNIRLQGKTLWEQLKQLKGHFDPTAPLPFASKDSILPDCNTRLGRKIMRQLTISAHYEGYLNREEASVTKLKKLESWRIPEGFNYDEIPGLRNEAKTKLKQVEPGTLAQAGRIDGVTPAELALLQVHLTRISRQREQ